VQPGTAAAYVLAPGQMRSSISPARRGGSDGGARYAAHRIRQRRNDKSANRSVLSEAGHCRIAAAIPDTRVSLGVERHGGKSRAADQVQQDCRHRAARRELRTGGLDAYLRSRRLAMIEVGFSRERISAPTALASNVSSSPVSCISRTAPTTRIRMSSSCASAAFGIVVRRSAFARYRYMSICPY